MGDADARRVHGQGMQLTSKGCSPAADGKSDAVGVKTDASGVVWSGEINQEAFGEANVSGRQQLFTNRLDFQSMKYLFVAIPMEDSQVFTATRSPGIIKLYL